MSEAPENMEFDKHIKNKYANHGIAPSNNLWEEINHKAAQLENVHLKKRVIFYKRLGIGMLILLLGVFSLYLYESNKQNNSINTNNIAGIEKLQSKNSDRQNSKLQTPNKVDNSLLTNSSDKQINIDKVIPKLPVLDKKKTIRSTLTIKEMPKIITSTTTSEEYNKQDDIITANIEDESFIVEDIKVENNIIKQLAVYSSLTEKGDHVSSITTPKNNKPQEAKSITNHTDLIITNSIDLQDDAISDSSLAENQNSTPNNIPSVPPIIPTKTLSRITVMALFSPTYSYRSITADNAAFYNKHQTGKMVYNAEVNIGYNVSNNLILRLGVNYNKLNQEIELRDKRPHELPITMDPDNENITIFSSLGTAEANNLSTFEFAGDDQDDYLLDDEDDFASLNFKEEQNFTFLNIPLTIAYELGKKKLRLIFQAGIVTSFIVKNDSKIQIENINRPANTVKIKDYHHSKKINFGGTVSLGAKYNIAKKFSILFLPTYNNSFTNFNKEKGNTLKPYSINFSMGLQYRF